MSQTTAAGARTASLTYDELAAMDEITQRNYERVLLRAQNAEFELSKFKFETAMRRQMTAQAIRRLRSSYRAALANTGGAA